MQSLLQAALDLSTSTKPFDSVTAARSEEHTSEL